MSKYAVRFTLLLLAFSLALPLGSLATSPADTLVVAGTTGMSGEFMTGMWGNNTSDVDIRILLHDYPTIIVGLDEQPAINDMVIRQHSRHLDAQGNTVHTFSLKPGLRFSDGSAITAKDYLFTILLESSPFIREIGGANTNRDHLVGSQAYVGGKSSVFSGLRLLGELQFSLTVSKEHLPYYYDLEYVQVQPYPVAVIAPGCQVRDEGQGAYVSGPFTAQLLQETILDPGTGYLTHPSVSSGAYRITMCDRVNRVAVFEANPYFLGNREGRQPDIKRIEVREIKNSQIATALETGQVHLVNKISAADGIDAVIAMPGHLVRSTAYPRNGFAYLNFSVERELPASLNLRKAITHLLNRDAVIQQFLRGYGEPVYGYYGLGQWMVKEQAAALKGLDKYPYDLAAATGLLAQDGWTLDSQGNDYSPQLGGLRHKRFDEELKPLSLRLAIAPDNKAADAVLGLLRESLEQVGGEVQVDYLPMSELLRQFYRQNQREFDLMFLASNFGHVFDPYYAYQVDDVYQGTHNTSGLKDPQLMALASDLRRTAPGDKASFITRWLAFQDYWTEVIPLVPLYSNTYVDAYSARLSNYHPERYHSWADAILYASFASGNP